MKRRILPKLSLRKDRIPSIRNFLLMVMLVLLSGFYSVGQIPVISVRYNNPTYNCQTKTYTVDVEFNSNTAGLRLFDMNVRFFYETSVLQYLSTGNFAQWYTSRPSPMPYISTESGTNFGISGDATYWNGGVFLFNAFGSDGSGGGIVTISNDPAVWTKIFSINFKVINPAAFSEAGICPTLIWDLEADPLKGGFGEQSDGVVITYLNPGTTSPFLSCTENVVQFNWAYDADPATLPYGAKTENNCIQGDEIPPVITTLAISGDQGCNPVIVAPVFFATDNCDNLVTPVVTTDGPTHTGCDFSQTWTANATDLSGNHALPVSVTYTWTEDTELPVITSADADKNLGCNPVVVAPAFSATDNCQGVVTPTVTSAGPAQNGCARTQTWTANYTDGCNNAALPVSITYTWTVDNVLPVITAVDGNRNLGCNPSVVTPTFTATDNCQGAVTPVVTTTGPTNNGCAYSQTWTANYTDPCNNAALPVSVTYTWTRDTELPLIVAVDNSKDLGCNPVVVTPAFTATDNCQGVVTPVVTTAGPSQNGCARTQTWTANYTDGCSNAALPVSVTYTWTVDNVLPVITAVDNNKDLGCNPSVVTPTFTATDNCQGAVSPVVTTSGPTHNGCAYTQTWTANYTDGCNNAALPVNVTYTWKQDTELPVILALETNRDLGCNPTVVTPTFTASDNCQGVVTPIVTSAGPTHIGCAWTQTWTANYTDGCSNAALPVSTTYTWTVDRTPPVLSGCPAATINLGVNPPEAPDCADAIALITATDECGGNITPTCSAGNVISNGCQRTQSFTVTATDGCQNAASCVVTFTWTVDTGIPDFVNCPSAPVLLGCNPVLPDCEDALARVTVMDGCSGTLTPTCSAGPVTENGCGRSQTFTLVATNNVGNSATCTVTFAWTEDRTLPVITTLAENENLGCNPVVVAPLFTASDNCEGTVTPVVTTAGPTHQGCAWSQTWTANYTDGCNNHALPVSITYTWTVDTEIPVITTVATNRDLGCNPVSVVAPVFTASDNCQGIVVPVVTTSGPMGADCQRSQTWTANYTDGCGKEALPVSITYTWKQDLLPPDFVTPADVTMEAAPDHRYDASPAITGYPTGITDNCPGVPAVTHTDVLSPGTVQGTLIITRTWRAVDLCNNHASKVQRITVIGGCIAPELNLSTICVYLTENGKWTLNKNDIFNMTKNMSGQEGYSDFTISVMPGSFDCNDTQSPVKVTVSVSNSCGLTATGTSEVTVADTIRPVALCRDITVYLDKFDQAYIVPTDVNRSDDRSSVPEWGKTFGLLAGGSYDNCGIEEMKLSKELYTSANIGVNEVMLVVYDHTRNSDVCLATVTVIDTITSVLEPINPVVMTVDPGVCKTKITYPELKYSGVAPAKIELEAGLGPDGEFPLGTTAERWKATDQAGKLSYTSFTVTVKTYNAAPVMNTVADITVNEDAAGFEIPLSGIGYGNDCIEQQIVSLVTTNSNPEILTVSQEYVNGAATGKLLVTPLPNKSGEAVITLTLKDNGGKENGGNDTMVKSFKIIVNGVNDPPTVKPVADQLIVLPGTLSVNMASAFSDPDAGDELTLTATQSDGTALPAWMNFNPATGLLSGTPSAANLGVTEVKVVATDKAGASVQDIFLVVVTDPALVTMNVSATKGTTPLTAGFKVSLFVKDGSLYNPVTTAPVFLAGTYTFFNLPLGTYLAKAWITDPAVNPGLMNTWYESATSVTGAMPVVASTPGLKTVVIKMVSSGLGTGDGRISGIVVRKTGTPDLITQGKDPGGIPAAGVDVVLKQNGVVVANTVTGTDGKYVFSLLPIGEYDAFVEVPGYTQNFTQKVTLTTAAPVKEKVDFTIWTSDGSRIITEILQVNAVFDAVLYPNPTGGPVNIDLTWNDVGRVDVSVFNMLGVEVFRNRFNAGELIRFDLGGKASGIYMVKIQGEGRTLVKKVTLDRR